MNLIYSRTKVQGAAYRPDVRVLNPRFFTEAASGATAVFVNGDYPEIKAAYSSANIPVADFTDLTSIPVVEEPKAKGKSK
jgi:hypothetical protein